MKEETARIVFMGTPDFAVASLNELVQSKHNVVGVVTVADKPAGRGQQIRISPVKKAAIASKIPVLQPQKLKDPSFIEDLRNLHADIFVVVAFRMLPEIVWQMPRLGTFNLHASLLPQYRGAAPINWAIINGEKETGITTFLLNHDIDTGKVLMQQSVPIPFNMSAGDLHDQLMQEGARLTLTTVDGLFNGELKGVPQSDSDYSRLKNAPKIFKSDCEVNWNLSAIEIYNKIRGLSPYPASWTELMTDDGKTIKIKLFSSEIADGEFKVQPGEIRYSDDSLIIGTASKPILIKEFQPDGKRRMLVADFLRGFRGKFTRVS